MLPKSLRNTPRCAKVWASLVAVVAAAALPSSPASAGGLNSLSAVQSGDSDGNTTIVLRGSSTPIFTVYKLDNPDRVVVDISNARLSPALSRSGDGKVVWQTNTWAVSSVTGYPRAGGKRVRVVVSLARPSAYTVKASGNDVVIQVTPREKPPASTSGDAARELDAQRRAVMRQRQATLREAEKLRAARAAARAEAERARAEREKAENLVALAEKMREQAKGEMARAREAVREARASAVEAQKEARSRRIRADRRIAEARKLVTESRARMERAREAEEAARRALAGASRREESAALAEARARESRQRAEAARKSAEARKRTAERARQRGDGRARELAVEAEKLAAEAEKRRLAALAAAREAAAKRKAAVASGRAAREQAEKASAQLAAARDEQKIADEKRALAEKARALAEKRRRAAEAEAAAAEKRVAELRSSLSSIAGEVARAKELRARELASLRRAETARAEAEKRQQGAAAAAARVEASLRAIRAALTRAQQSQSAARAAAAQVARYQKQKKVDKAKLRELREQADKLAAAHQAARRALEDQKKELEARKRRAETLAKQRDQAVAELSKIQKAVTDAGSRRQAEEARLAELAAKRKRAEVQFAKLRSAARQAAAERASEERKLAEARAELAEVEGRLARARARFAKMESARSKAARLEKQARQSLDETREELEAARAEAARLARVQRNMKAKASAAEARLEKVTTELKASARPRLREFDYRHKSSRARVVLALSSPATPRVVSVRGNQATLVVPGVSMPDELEKTIDASRFGGPIRAVSAFRDRKDPDNVKVVVDLAEPSKGVLKRVGNTYYWDFPASRRTADRRTKQTRKSRPRATSYRTPSFASSRSGAGRARSSSAPITQASVAGRGRRVYRGRPIDLDFKDADIHNLLRLLADVGGVNIVIPDEIKASVTVRLRRVPWDQAMEVILASKGLWYRRQGDLIRIAPRKELDAEDKAEAERRAARIQAEAPEPEIFTLNYAQSNELRRQLRPLLSPKGRIEIDRRTNALIVVDLQAHRRRIIDLARRLDTQTPQIQIEARIVEARTTFVRQFGIQWGGNATASAATGNATGLVFPSSVGVAGAADDNQGSTAGVGATPPNFAVNLPAPIGAGAGGGLGFSFGSVGGNFNINLRLSALEDIGTARIVSSPKITVINNAQATISSGVSIPISVVSANGVQTQFVPADLSLRVTPTVSQRDCSISMQVNVTKNEPDFANTGARGDPSIIRREARTTIIVDDGETAVIGGVYQRNTGRNYNKVPFLADIPVIGLLFKSRRDSDDRSEVLVFLTPKITNRAFLQCAE